MKTLSFTAGLLLLLLLTVYHCTTMHLGPNEMSPASCCFKFFPKRIPKPHIISIIKTHKRCSEKAFVVVTPYGPLCVRQALDWAKKAFNEQSSENQ
ncbi:C-C motif chemokine 5-like isoform X4 [Lates calcarifer]|uniref:C-C motif chemokine 5-like isoform X2 n=2 Tax=Lates calcarifer TaxID=8187 RepID=A0AAJ8BB40_LATCA|nr:C-C motif chemokine 5-like isoform X2 [Lates calcarifer]XP_050929582.1 C-C motif chemokine 5-like isoform X3 [Lates calcarifer]XP_050929583.1 C-C motif chemokine 5-like isoform X4 [Lates calcarifer]